jgi:hypothetical protein
MGEETELGDKQIGLTQFYIPALRLGLEYWQTRTMVHMWPRPLVIYFID